MDAQGTMRLMFDTLMFDTMDASDRADFDRLAEIYATDRRSDPVVSVFSFKGRRIASIAGLPLDGSRRGGDGGPKPGTRLSGGGVAGDPSRGRS